MKTRKELTDRAGLRRVSAGTLGKIERGERPLDPHEAEAFARALNIDSATFYDEPDGTQLDRIQQDLADIASEIEQNRRALELIMLKLGINLPDAPAEAPEIPRYPRRPPEDQQQAPGA